MTIEFLHPTGGDAPPLLLYGAAVAGTRPAMYGGRFGWEPLALRVRKHPPSGNPELFQVAWETSVSKCTIPGRQ
jgi:hypothetical protein